MGNEELYSTEICRNNDINNPIFSVQRLPQGTSLFDISICLGLLSEPKHVLNYFLKSVSFEPLCSNEIIQKIITKKGVHFVLQLPIL